MGMPIILDLRDPRADDALVRRVFDWFRWVDAVFSTYRRDSDISRLNRGEITLAEAHPEVRSVLERCESLRWETSGYFDIRAPHLPPEARSWDEDRTAHAVDPTGLVKGWSVDRATQILDEAGIHNYAVNAGGDMRVRGGALPQEEWRVGIRHPYVSEAMARVVTATSGAVATSGTYERGNHIVNPHTGHPPQGVLSVTITGPELGTADAYATAIFAMGPPGVEWAARLDGYEAMLILDDNTVWLTPQFPAVPA